MDSFINSLYFQLLLNIRRYDISETVLRVNSTSLHYRLLTVLVVCDILIKH